MWPLLKLVNRRRSVGYVIQEVGLLPHLTVADNIAVVPRLERWEEPRVGATSALSETCDALPESKP